MEKKDDNIIRVGKKSVRVYAEACMVSLDEQKNKEIVLKTRGMNIGKVVSIAEFLKRKNNLKVTDIKIGSEEFPDKKEEGKTIFISTIDVIMTK